MIKLNIPDEHVKNINNNDTIEKAFLEILSFITGKEIISEKPEINFAYMEQTPVSRSAKYGDKIYGLYMKADPIQSGIGVHGEEARWKFYGLPEDIRLKGQSRLDMRGGNNNYVSLEIICSDKKLKNKTESLFKIKIEEYLTKK